MFVHYSSLQPRRGQKDYKRLQSDLRTNQSTFSVPIVMNAPRTLVISKFKLTSPLSTQKSIFSGNLNFSSAG